MSEPVTASTSFVNQSPGIRRWHTSPASIAAYTYIPANADLPPLYSQEHVPDPLARIKLFLGGWTWYLTEWDGDDTAFGLVVGLETELGYISLSELATVRGQFGLPVERDIHFTPQLLSVVRANHMATPGRPNRSSSR